MTDPTLFPSTDGLAARMLAFERQHWQFAGAKERAIQDEFGLSATSYYQRLNRIINDPASLEIDPVTVRRLQRIRGQSRVRRSA